MNRCATFFLLVIGLTAVSQSPVRAAEVFRVGYPSLATGFASTGFREGPFQAQGKGVRFVQTKVAMQFRVEIEQEEDGRWIAEVVDLSGVLAYGNTREEAKAKVQALALRVVADRLEHGEAGPELVSISFAAA